MNTLRIDLSALSKETAAGLLRWDDYSCRVVLVRGQIDPALSRGELGWHWYWNRRAYGCSAGHESRNECVQQPIGEFQPFGGD